MEEKIMLYMEDMAHREYEDFRRKRDEEMLAQSLGWMLLKCEKTMDTAALVEQVKGEAEKCLVDIVAILDRAELNDFHCVDKIIERLEKLGLTTSRHDFG